MDKEQRIQRWLNDGCPRKAAEAVVALEEAEATFAELETLLYSLNDTRLIEKLNLGMRKLIATGHSLGIV